MEKRTPFFLTRLLRRNRQNSEFSEQSGWKNTEEENTTSGGWGSSPVSTSSGTIAINGWVDEPPDNHYNGWGSGSLHKSPTPETSTNGWTYEKPKNEYNGWGSSPDPKSTTQEASSNGWVTDKLPKFESESESEPISKQSRFVNTESFPCPPVPSAPPLPDIGFSDHDASNTFNHLGFDSVKKDVVSLMDQSKNGDGSCVVCWEAPVDGACVPCGHMVSCMPCLLEIESKQGTCPVCRAKIDKVLRIYAFSTG